MKIVNIVPGFGGTFYCGNCLRDSAFVQSLREAGHDAITLPMYLPLSMQGAEAEMPVFYGAVGIYLREFPLFRNMPGWMERLVNSRPMLRFAARKAGSTRAQGMEELTESMLLGTDGRQYHELQHLVDFLKYQVKPDIVHFSNALLLGMARQIREEVKVSVICSLQDEDVWVDAMEENYREKIWNLMSEKCHDVDAFVAVSRWFGDRMQEQLKIPSAKMHILPIGIDPGKYTLHTPASRPQAIGYLSRICCENGFGVLVDAFVLLKRDPRFLNLKLQVTGGMTGDDKSFLQGELKKLELENLLGDIIIHYDYDKLVLADFFRGITLLSVPVLKGEAFGLYQLEALASGIPIVQPGLGAFPEIINATGGGMTYTPNTPEKLAETLAGVLTNPGQIEEMSRKGRQSVETEFNCSRITAEMVEIYSKTIDELRLTNYE